MFDIVITMDRTQIADYLAKKVFNGELKTGYYIILKNKQIYPKDDYGRLVKSNKISPEDTFAYINFTVRVLGLYKDHIIMYLFPLMVFKGTFKITISYLSKLGFYNPSGIYPATGLKYYGVITIFSDRLVIEIIDIDTVTTNIGLRKIVTDVLGKDMLTQDEISYDQIFEIQSKLDDQVVFAGHDLYDALKIIKDYYTNHNTSLAKDVLAITNAYDQIFQPYRVVYDTRTGQQVLM